MMTIEQLEKHFKIRRSASSIMIKEIGTSYYIGETNEQIAYVFRGNPCTHYEQVKELFACL